MEQNMIHKITADTERHQLFAQQLWHALHAIADATSLDDVPPENRVETLQLLAIQAISKFPQLTDEPVGYVGKASLQMLLAGENNGCVLTRTAGSGVEYVPLFLSPSPPPTPKVGAVEDAADQIKALSDAATEGRSQHAFDKAEKIVREALKKIASETTIGEPFKSEARIMSRDDMIELSRAALSTAKDGTDV